jgi:TRAP-type uncharacterized transport system fused permease subunit
MRTAWNGFFMAIPGLIVPVLFVYRPELLWVGDLASIVGYVFVSVNIIILLSAAIQGWFLGNLSWPARCVLVIPALMMCIHSPTVLYSGLGLSFLAYAYHAYRRYVLKPGITAGRHA